MFRFRKREEEKEYDTYPGLPYHAGQLSAYSASNDHFTISVKGGEVVNYTPEDVVKFQDWLMKNNIRDINAGKPL